IEQCLGQPRRGLSGRRQQSGSHRELQKGNPAQTRQPELDRDAEKAHISVREQRFQASLARPSPVFGGGNTAPTDVIRWQLILQLPIRASTARTIRSQRAPRNGNTLPRLAPARATSSSRSNIARDAGGF